MLGAVLTASASASNHSAMTQEQLDAFGGGAADQAGAGGTPGLPGGSPAFQLASLITQSQKKQRSPRLTCTTPKRMKMYEDDTSSTEYAGGDAEQVDDSTTQQGSCTQHAQPQHQNGAAGQPHGQQQGEDGTVFSPSFHVPRNRRSSLDAHHQHQHLQHMNDLEHQPQHMQHHAAEHHAAVTCRVMAAWAHTLPGQPAQASAHEQPNSIPIDQPCAIEEDSKDVTMSHECAMAPPTEAAVHAPDANGMQIQQSQHETQQQLQRHQVAEVSVVVAETVAVEQEAAAVAAEGEEELDYMDFDPLLFIKLLPPLEQVVPKHRKPLLPRKTRLCKQQTLVLDLDETLVHSCLEAQSDADFTFPVHFNAQEHLIHVKQRPHLHTFMNRVAELFEVVVFTASQKVYAEKLLNIIDPERKLIKHRIFRESCVVVDGNYLKDLTSLGRDLRTTLIVDNSPQAFGFQVDNGVPIESWYDDPADTELLKLLPFLEELVGQEDVRPAIRNKFHMRELIDRVVC